MQKKEQKKNNKIDKSEKKEISKLLKLNQELYKNQMELKKENERILKYMKKLENNSGTVINNNITLISYNDTPDLSHLTNIDYLNIMNKGIYSVPSLIEAIHFNPKKPENRNIYIPNLKNKYVMVWNGNNWKLFNRQDVLNQLYEHNSNILIDKMEEFIDIGEKLEPRIMKKFKRFVEKKKKIVLKIK